MSTKPGEGYCDAYSTLQEDEFAETRRLWPDDLSVYFFEVTEDFVKVGEEEETKVRVQVREIGVTDDGDFEDKWPGGFFNERDSEF